MAHLQRRLTMDKFIGFDIDHKHTVACGVHAGQPERYGRLRTDVGQLREWLKTECFLGAAVK